MGAMYGTRPLSLAEQKGWFTLSNGMYGVWGEGPDGVSVDIYRDAGLKDLVSMQHGIVCTSMDTDLLQMLMESMIDEF